MTSDSGMLPLHVIGEFLRDLTATMLLGSAEGAIILRESVQDAARAFGVAAEVLVLTEQVALTVAKGQERVAYVVRETPTVARLDIASSLKPLLLDISSGRVTLEEASSRLHEIRTRPRPRRWWWRSLGVVLFAAGFAPSVQARWAEVGDAIVLGGVMGLLFVAAENRRIEPLLPVLGSFVVALLGFVVLDAADAPGGPVAVMIPALFVLIPGD